MPNILLNLYATRNHQTNPSTISFPPRVPCQTVVDCLQRWLEQFLPPLYAKPLKCDSATPSIKRQSLSSTPSIWTCLCDWFDQRDIIRWDTSRGLSICVLGCCPSPTLMTDTRSHDANELELDCWRGHKERQGPELHSLTTIRHMSEAILNHPVTVRPPNA